MVLWGLLWGRFAFCPHFVIIGLFPLFVLLSLLSFASALLAVPKRMSPVCSSCVARLSTPK